MNLTVRKSHHASRHFLFYSALALYVFCIVVASPSKATAQTTNIPLAFSTTDRNGTASVTITGLPRTATGDATINLNVFGDLNGNPARENLVISIDGVVVDTVTRIRQCNRTNPIANRAIVVPQATLAPLIADGELVVSYRGGNRVDNICPSLLGAPNRTSFGAVGTITYASAGILGGEGATSAGASVARFLENRARALVQNQPDVVRFVDGRTAGQFNAEVTQGIGDLQFSSGFRGPFWVALQASWTDGDFGEQTYVLGSIGAHKRLAGNTVVGAMLQFDFSKREENGIADTEGTGWLFGPYFASQLGQYPLYFDGRLLYGQTDNEVTATGAPREEFDGERWLVMIGLEGAIETQTLTIFPGIDINYVSDKQNSFVDSTATFNSSQTVEQTEVALGLDFEMPLTGHWDKVVLTWGGSAIWSETDGSGPSASIVQFDDDWRGRIDLGYRFNNGNGLTSDANLFVDGIGSNQDSIGLSAIVSLVF